ncbi:hypothetical protein Tco_0097731 [Tanacetum coccineum]
MSSGGGLLLYQAYGNLYAMTGRKAHLLEDKKIPSVWVFDEVPWNTFGGNTRDLDSILEETGQEYEFTTKEGLKNKSQMVETTSGKLATSSGSASDGVRISCDDECPKNIDLGVAKNLKKPSQAPRYVPVGPKMGFKPVKQFYKPVFKNTNANTSKNKKKDVEHTKEVSNSNPFNVLNSVENDVDLGTNGGTLNLASKKANSSGFSFWNMKSSRKPLENIDSSNDHNSEDEVESVDNKMASFLASKKVGYGTNSLLKQWKETYENADYDHDPYDDDMYESQEIPDMISSICDNLDIKVRRRKVRRWLILLGVCAVGILESMWEDSLYHSLDDRNHVDRIVAVSALKGDITHIPSRYRCALE